MNIIVLAHLQKRKTFTLSIQQRKRVDRPDMEMIPVQVMTSLDQSKNSKDSYSI